MNLRKSQSGYSLIELVLAVTIMVGVFAVFSTFLSGLLRGAAQANESAKNTEDAAFMAAGLQKDFEALGRNMSVPASQIFAGTMQIPFYPHPDFSENRPQAELDRVSAAIQSPIQAGVVFRGNAELSGKCFACLINVAEENAPQNYWQINLVQQTEEGAEQVIRIYENGELKKEVTNSSSTAHQLSIVFSGIYSSDSALNCTAAYMLDNTAIYQSSAACTDNYKTASFDTPVGSGGIQLLVLTAGDIARPADSVSTPAQLAVLPMYQGARPATPFIPAQDKLILFNAADAVPMVLQSPANVAQSEQFDLAVDSASAVAVGDILFLADYLNGRSVLLEVVGEAGNIITVKRIDRSNTDDLPADIAGFVSSDADFYGLNMPDGSNFPFPNGSRLVKLDVVEYAVRVNTTGGNEYGLYRRENGLDWELILPNIANFSVTPQITATGIGYEITVDVLSEGIESSQKSQTLHLSVNPRALNRTFDVR